MELTVLRVLMHISLINAELFLWNDRALSRVHLRSEMLKAVVIYCTTGRNA